MKQTTQRCLVVLLTYNKRYLEAAGRSLDVLSDIDIAKEDARTFIPAFRKMLRRLHPELKIEMSAFRVTEIAPHETEESSEYEKPDRRMSGLWFGYRTDYVRPRKRPRDGPPQSHSHLCLWFNVEWKDQERQSREPAQWSDDLIPHLRTDGYLYDHHWENKAEAKVRGGRVRKLATPWPWGFISYSDARGGEGKYFAKYAVKCMQKRLDWIENHRNGWSEDQIRDYENSEKTWKSIRRSPKTGYDYYGQRAVLAAQAGLPPRLYFEFAEGGQPGEARLVYDWGSGQHVWAEGGPFKRTITTPGDLVFDGQGELKASRNRRRISPSFLLQKVGRQRAYFRAYDAEWERLNGTDAAQPVGPAVRSKIVDGRIKQVIVYGVEEAREQVAKDDDRRFIAQRDRYLGRVRYARSGGDNPDKRRRRALKRLEARGPVPTLEELEHLHPRVGEELRFPPLPPPIPKKVVSESRYERLVRVRDDVRMRFSSQSRSQVERSLSLGWFVGKEHYQWKILLALIRHYDAEFKREEIFPLRSRFAACEDRQFLAKPEIREFYARERRSLDGEIVRPAEPTLFQYCRSQVALTGFSDEFVEEIVDGIKRNFQLSADGSRRGTWHPCAKEAVKLRAKRPKQDIRRELRRDQLLRARAFDCYDLEFLQFNKRQPSRPV